MASVGDIATAKQLGKGYCNRLIYVVCPDCKKERWANLRPSNTSSTRLCLSCNSKRNWKSGLRKRWDNARENNPMWKGGRINQGGGYIQCHIDSNDPFYLMGRKKKGMGEGRYISEHRLLMARFLGRVLLDEEIVHHKNGVKYDNRIENLELTNRKTHIQDHGKGYIDGFNKGITDSQTRLRILEHRVSELEIENKKLVLQLTEVQH